MAHESQIHVFRAKETLNETPRTQPKTSIRHQSNDGSFMSGPSLSLKSDPSGNHSNMHKL